METISDSTELFATCQLGSHLLPALGTVLYVGHRGGRHCCDPRGIHPLGTTLAPAPRGAPVPKTPQIPTDLSLGLLDCLFLFGACLFGAGGGSFFSFVF